jgi:ABC-type multidrug transport system ATPase subunit
MRVAAGYHIPSEGEIFLENANIVRESPWSCLKSISFCPEDNYLYENMTVEEHLLLVSSLRDLTKVNNVEDHITWILTTLDIVVKRTTLTKNLSGGMKRRLCLAMSIFGFPKVILCDEPSSGVDSTNQRGIWKLLETAKKHSAILLTSHSTLEAVILSDSVVMMESSTLISQTTGIQNMAFSLKDDVDNTTVEYNITSIDEVAQIVASLPSNSREWKLASKRLTSTELPRLRDVLMNRGREGNAPDNVEIVVEEVSTTQATCRCEAPSTLRQMLIIMSMMIMHPDRIFFLVFFGLPINGAQIWLASAYGGFEKNRVITITPLIPLIAIVSSAVIMLQVTKVYATERSLGVKKLIMSQGISRFAYLSSYALIYFLLSFPVRLSSRINPDSESINASYHFNASYYFFKQFVKGIGWVHDRYWFKKWNIDLHVRSLYSLFLVFLPTCGD